MTAEELLAALEQEIEWRDTELRLLRRTLTDTDTALERGKRRAMVPMVLAHAEGFVRFALQAYLQFITVQEAPAKSVREVHVAWTLTREFNRIRENSVDESFKLTGMDGDNRKGRKHYAESRLLESLSEQMEQRVSLDGSALDQFDKNLDKAYLHALLFHCGLDPSPHSIYADKLNGLVVRRNQVAHGERTEASLNEIDKWLDAVQNLFKVVRDEVYNHAYHKKFLKSLVA